MARPRSTTPAPATGTDTVAAGASRPAAAIPSAAAPRPERRSPSGAVPQPGHPTRTRRRREPALPLSPAHPAPGAGAGRAGFVLYVGLADDDADAGGGAAELAEVAEALRDLAQDLLPAAETFTALSLVPGTGSDDVQSLRARLAGLRPLGPAGTTDATADPASA